MRPSQFRRLAALAAFGAILAGAVLGTGIAKADVLTDVAYCPNFAPLIGLPSGRVMA